MRNGDFSQLLPNTKLFRYRQRDLARGPNPVPR